MRKLILEGWISRVGSGMDRNKAVGISKTSFLFIFCSFASLLVVGQDSINLNGGKPFILGEIKELQSNILSEKRVLNIYLPDGYNKKDTIKYPVIYLLDGSADEDFIHIAGLVQFLNFPWVKILPNSILVGIANVDRKRDFTYPTKVDKDRKDFPTTGKSGNFMIFIEKELQPFIEKNYKTTASKTIIGQSFGGLLATEILFKKPKLFTNYIIVSPSLWWDNESLLTMQPAIFNYNFADAISVFIAVGNEGKVMEADSRKLVSILEKEPKKNMSVNFEYFPGENHATILHNAVYKGFEKINKNARKK